MSNTKQYDNYADLITFTRASTGTYLDSDGLLKTATTNTPRIEYDANGNRKGLLIEEARTNLLLRSDDLTVSPWTLSNTTTASETGPFAGSTAYAVIEDDTADGTIHAANQIISFTSGTTYTVSIWAKSSNRRMQIAGANAGVFPASVVFDLQNGTVSLQLNGTGSIQDFGNGWYRCSVTATAAATSATNVSFRLALTDNDATYDGDGTSKVTFWGAQLEAGSFPTSYIPTAGSTATRAADVASIPTSAFGFNPDKGSVVVDYSTFTAEGTTRIVEFESDSSNRVTLYNGAISENASLFATVGGSPQADFSTANQVPATGIAKVGFTFSLNDFAITLNGGAMNSDVAALVPPIDNVLLGDSNAAGVLNGHIKSIQYYPRRLTNAQLQELTS